MSNTNAVAERMLTTAPSVSVFHKLVSDCMIIDLLTI